MNAHSDFLTKIVHVQSESVFTINQNQRSSSAEYANLLTVTYRYEKAKKSFDLLLKKASHGEKVAIRKNDQLYILTSASKNVSLLDVEGIDMGISSQEIVQFIHESRKL